MQTFRHLRGYVVFKKNEKDKILSLMEGELSNR